MYKLTKRTFEAKLYPVGSAKRNELNESTATSEYMVSHKYAVVGEKWSRAFRTKGEAESYCAKLELEAVIHGRGNA